MEPANRTRLHILIAGIFFISAMLSFIIYSNIDFEITIPSITLKKNKDLKLYAEQTKKKETSLIDTKKDSAGVNKTRTVSALDTTSQRFLVIGDSQVEGLMYPMYDYFRFNRDSLALALVWYSATDMTYASCDTLKHIIEKHRPSHIIMVIGLNQIMQKSFESSEKAVSKILETIGDIPYTWVGPANWVPDLGINEVYRKQIPEGKLFLSKDLILERAKDGRHPSRKACYVWMDSIANWMQTKSTYKLRLLKPDTVYSKTKLPIMMLNAAKKDNKQN